MIVAERQKTVDEQKGKTIHQGDGKKPYQNRLDDIKLALAGAF